MIKRSPFLLLIILLLTGCSTITLQNPTPTTGMIYASMTAEMGGELSIKNECIRVGNHTLVWPADFSVQIENNSVSVTSGMVTGRRKQDTFHDGDLVQSGGGIVETRDELDDTIYNTQFNEHLEESVPAHCPAPFWVVGSIDHYPPAAPTSLAPADLSKPIPFPLQDKPDGERAVMDGWGSLVAAAISKFNPGANTISMHCTLLDCWGCSTVMKASGFQGFSTKRGMK